MKRTILSFLFILFITSLYAQKDVTLFLGIPVDGYKSDMKKALVSKGFEYDNMHDCFLGEFNGRDVIIQIATNNNKVWRLMITDLHECNETDIKIRFNNLCRQFEKNAKYLSANLGEKDYIIPDDEDISYGMLVNKKRYEASYCQKPDSTKTDIKEAADTLNKLLSKLYTQEQLDNPTEEQKKEIDEHIKTYSTAHYLSLLYKKSVWFMINEHYGKYRIIMYYDNEYNHSDGEDL